jgi:hypothetical protein
MSEVYLSQQCHLKKPHRIVQSTELLRSKPAIVGHFMQLIVPILVDVYAASVITPVRVKILTGLLKAVSFLDGDGLKRVLTVKLPALYCYHVSHVCSVCSCGELCIVYPVF